MEIINQHRREIGGKWNKQIKSSDYRTYNRPKPSAAGANTVRIYLVCRASANITASQTLGIIPEPYRPKTPKAVFCYEKMNNNSAQLAYPGVVGANGNVRQTGTSAALECLVVGEYSLD